MTPIILSSDGPMSVFMVPDKVANNLDEYCNRFSDEGIWALRKKQGKEYFHAGALCYTEHDFIQWLNTLECPNERSWFVDTMEKSSPIWNKYRKCNKYNF